MTARTIEGCELRALCALAAAGKGLVLGVSRMGSGSPERTAMAHRTLACLVGRIGHVTQHALEGLPPTFRAQGLTGDLLMLRAVVRDHATELTGREPYLSTRELAELLVDVKRIADVGEVHHASADEEAWAPTQYAGTNVELFMAGEDDRMS